MIFGRLSNVLALALGTAVALGATLALVEPATGQPAPGRPVAFVPLDDRPVTYQLPILLGKIAGRPLLTPPRASIGNYLQPGDPDAIVRWLSSDQTQDVAAIVASSDMLAYGGLVAARIPGVAASDAYVRLRALADLKRQRDVPFVGVFGTIMRLAPTGVPRLGAAAHYYATGATVDDLQAYANLPDPPVTPADQAKTARLRAAIGEPTLASYLATRARDRAVDVWALQMAAEGGFDRLIIGQDDAGPTGLHLKDVAALKRTAATLELGPRASIEPGADELGMVVLAQALARSAGWLPSVRVVYSRADGGAVSDRLEFEPIEATIERLIAACGARRVASGADIALYVRVADSAAPQESAFEDALVRDVASGKSVTVADLTFLSGTPGAEQRELTDALIARKVAGKLDGFASWNTDANTVGTSLAAAIATGAGRRTGGFDARAHAEFMLDRYVDDYAFHQFVRPQLNAALRRRDVDTTLLLPEIAREASDDNRAALWPYALDLLARIYPQYRDRGLTITLPWDRTFETQIDVRL